MRSSLSLVFVLVIAIHSAFADISDTVRLWESDAPGALGAGEHDIPTLKLWLVSNPTSQTAAMVVCPGGGYHALAPHEGDAYARWFNEMGISAFVLRYRLGSHGYRHPAMLNDVSRALRIVRARAREWNVDPARVGVIGSSAGGHLASTVMTHFDGGDPGATDPIEQQSSRPDLGILCYPVISSGEFAHAGSMRNLLGDSPDPSLLKSLSNELQVTSATPPAFLFHTADDKVVSVHNSLLFARALSESGVAYGLHIYPSGPHGLGLGTREWNPDKRHPWTTQCELWLKERGFAR